MLYEVITIHTSSETVRVESSIFHTKKISIIDAAIEQWLDIGRGYKHLRLHRQ